MSENWTPPPGTPSIPPAPEMNYALWADRVIAALADVGIAVLVMIALYVLLIIVTFVFSALGMVGSGLEQQATGGEPGLIGLITTMGGCGFYCLIIFLPPISYFVAGLLNKVYWVSKRGYSIGQGLMKLKVVDQHGNLVSMGTATIRLLATVGLGFIPVVGGFLDLLWPLWDKQRQTLHDKAVGTFVIKVG